MRLAPLLLALALLIAGCTTSGRDTATQPIHVDASHSNWTLTQPIWSPPPENTEGGPPNANRQNVVPSHSWFTNADRTLWMMDLDRAGGKPIKTAWFRPRDTQLVITGRRLDGDAPPLVTEVPPKEQYPRRMFTPTRLTFPTDGIWEITGKAGQSELRVVVKVPSTAPTKPPA